MGRYINTNTGGKSRDKLNKMIVLAIRQLMTQQEISPETMDLVAFLILSLKEVALTIDESVSAWEKKGYWVKADRYRMEWEWSAVYAAKLDQAFQAEDWASIALLATQIAQKLKGIEVSPNHRLGTPWTDAYQAYQQA